MGFGHIQSLSTGYPPVHPPQIQPTDGDGRVADLRQLKDTFRKGLHRVRRSIRTSSPSYVLPQHCEGRTAVATLSSSGVILAPKRVRANVQKMAEARETVEDMARRGTESCAGAHAPNTGPRAAARCHRANWRGATQCTLFGLQPTGDKQADATAQKMRPEVKGTGSPAMPRFAANVSLLFNEVPFLERFAEAAHAGFRAVECMFPYDMSSREIKEQLKETPARTGALQCASWRLGRGRAGYCIVAGSRARFCGGLRHRTSLCAATGCTRVHAMAGLVPADADAEQRARARSTFIRNLRFACSEAHQLGITVLIEPLNPRDMPNYLLSRQDDAHAIRAEVGAPNLKVQMDLYHAQIVEGDLSERIRRWLPHIGHIQVAGVPGTPRARYRRDQLRVDIQVAGRAQIRRLDRLRISAAREHRGGAYVALSAARSGRAAAVPGAAPGADD